MNPETTSDKHTPAVDNELDIRGLCCTLWRGKPWIIGIAVLFAAVALIVSYLVKQEWSATAITDRPTVNVLGGYYSQQQFLRNLDVRTLPAAAAGDQPSIADEAYNEFIMQLAAYDTRRDFWLQSDYYKQRQEGDARADAALLDELINNILFTPRDKKVPNDGVKLTAETAADANRLLRQYVAFASHRAALHLNEEIQGAWAARTTSMKAQVKRQEAVAESVYKRELNTTQQALKIAESQGSAVRKPTLRPNSCRIRICSCWAGQCCRRVWKACRPPARPTIWITIRTAQCWRR